MREVELKAVVPDLDDARARVERAGGRLVFAGRLEDRRWDTPNGEIEARDHVLRVRVYRGELAAGLPQVLLDWKGPTTAQDGYKVREELSVPAADAETLGAILERLGYVIVREVDRDVVQYDLHGAMVRFERYPRMDVLVEIEGDPESIERAIRDTGIARDAFTTDALAAFIERYEARTGRRAATSERALDGAPWE